ncbi:assimilatory sulfite reductase [Sesbania bispinosa]|nr:assimilatory sulfite reductase [Sesbania bispinosa]
MTPHHASSNPYHDASTCSTTNVAFGSNEDIQGHLVMQDDPPDLTMNPEGALGFRKYDPNEVIVEDVSSENKDEEATEMEQESEGMIVDAQ